VNELATFMESLGHGVPVAHLEQMMSDLGIDEDADGSVEPAGFLEFVRRTLVADLPLSKMNAIHTIFEQAAQATSPGEVPNQTKERLSSVHEAEGSTPAIVTLDQAAEMLMKLGFVLDELSLEEVFEEVDVDGDGCITEVEFINCVGILKRNMLEVLTLEAAFTRFRENNPKRQSFKRFATETTPSPPPTRMRRFSKETTPEPAEQQDLIAEDDHHVYASDLIAALGVTELEAEEMIFIADLKDNDRIDFTEFKQVVVNWSG